MPLTLEQVSARLDRLPPSRYHVKILVVAALSLLFDTLDATVTSFVLATLRSIWHFDVKTIGLISAIGLSGYLVGSFSCGFIADRIGRRKTILFTLIFYSFFSAARGLSDRVAVFAVLNFLAWMFIGAESSTVPTYLAELWPARIRGKLVGAMMVAFGLGIALSPVWALAIIPSLGWRWALFLTAPFALVGGVIRSSLPESPRWLVRRGRLTDAEAALTTIESAVERSTGVTLSPIEPSALRTEGSEVLVRPSELLGRSYGRITLMLWALWFAEFGVLYTFQTFIPTILSAEGHSIVRSFRYSVVIYTAVIPGYFFGGYLIEWLDRKNSILLSFTSVALFGTLFGLAQSPIQTMLFGGLTFFFLATGSTSIYAYTPELYPTEIRATGMGIASAWGRAGAVTMLLSFGFLYASRGKSVLFIMSDLVLLVASVMVAAFGPSTRGRRLEDTSRGAKPDVISER